MSENANIEWTHHTFNPWWGCAKVSPGCLHCYACTLSHRMARVHFGNKNLWGPEAPRETNRDDYWKYPVRWNKSAARRGVFERVFCGSMCDVFEDRDDVVHLRERLWRLIADTPNLHWLLLTKRPQNIRKLSPAVLPANVWLGVSAENQEMWDQRLPILLDIPASVHFVSAEPLLGPIDMGRYRPDWLIVGGESHQHTPRIMDPYWVRSLRDQCMAKEVPFFFKQWGGKDKKQAGRELDGITWDQYPEPDITRLD